MTSHYSSTITAFTQPSVQARGFRNRYTSIYKSRALFVTTGDVMLINATLQDSSAHLSGNLYLKETTPVFI